MSVLSDAASTIFTVPGTHREVGDGAASSGCEDCGTQQSALAARLNWLRAGVLGANDGIVSVAGLVIGVAAAEPRDSTAILVAGVAGLLAGAVSMAAGEYVSVSTQRDTEKNLVRREKQSIDKNPAERLDRLSALYENRGLSASTAHTVAQELTAHDAAAAHLEAEYGLSEGEYSSPWQAAFSSAISFTIGALLPILSIIFLPVSVKLPGTFIAVMMGLGLTGWLSASLGGAPAGRAVARLIASGALAMAVTWGIGHLIGVSV